MLEIAVHPDFIDDEAHIRRRILEKAPHSADSYRIVRKSVDARRKVPHFVLQVALGSEKEAPQDTFRFAPVKAHPAVIVVGAGPAGYLAALTLIEHGIKPVVLERGDPVNLRRKRIAGLLRTGTLDPESNFCFGEGGAGAFSDGKLYTRATKRGDVGRILRLLVDHGAPVDILIDAHPHIGSNRLPTVVQRMRETILACGGEVHFRTRVTDFMFKNGTITGVRLADGARVDAKAVILATGNAARDIYTRLHALNIALAAKPLAVGVRVEHLQAHIDAMQYHHRPRHPKLPAAAYGLACQCEGRGVYSFCMCPGGYIVPTATGPCELAVNGMSFSGRKGRFANSGIVVELRPEDLSTWEEKGPLSVMAFQQALEKDAFRMGGAAGQKAPAQRMTDFMTRNMSASMPESSYLPGITSSPLHELLPGDVASRLRQALAIFDRKLKGFVTREALMVAVESRTSSPVHIPRDARTLMHPNAQGLFPCGEGAGHAGGIVSSAMDGHRVAKHVVDFIRKFQISPAPGTGFRLPSRL
jgi:uncharacterized protein